MRWRISRRACGLSVGRAAVDAAWRNAAARRTLQGRRIATGTGHRPGAGTGTDPRPVCARAALHAAIRRGRRSAPASGHEVSGQAAMAALGHRRAIAGGPPARGRGAVRAVRRATRLRLPPTFREALDHWTAARQRAIPQARLDWPGRCAATRRPTAQWERRARWGHLVDHLLFDWLECREDSVEKPCSCWASWTPANVLRAAARGGPRRGGGHRPRRSHVRRPDGAGTAGHSIALAGDAPASPRAATPPP